MQYYDRLAAVTYVEWGNISVVLHLPISSVLFAPCPWGVIFCSAEIGNWNFVTLTSHFRWSVVLMYHQGLLWLRNIVMEDIVGFTSNLHQCPVPTWPRYFQNSYSLNLSVKCCSAGEFGYYYKVSSNTVYSGNKKNLATYAILKNLCQEAFIF